MVKFRLVCPECTAVIITPSPDSLIWELCPSCKKHVWDVYDVMMTDVIPNKTQGKTTAREFTN